MSAIDQATVRVTGPAAQHRPTARERLRRWPAVSRVALAFAALWIPSTLIALVTEWHDGGAAPDEFGSLLGHYVLYGSAVSGPLQPQLILLVLAILARREGRLGKIATAGIGVMGVLIAFNGLASALADHQHAPQAVASAVGIGFFAAFGAAMIVLAARSLLAKRS